jgi:hypothetical protein
VPVLRPFAWLSLFAVLGCAREGVRVSKLPDGTRELRCDLPLWKCLLHVDDQCKGRTYEVLYASDEQLVFGSQASAVEGRRSHAVLRCLKSGASLPDAPLPGPEPSVSSVAPAPPAAPPAAPVAVERACVPGVTQACVGAAACAGGQSCLADGSGFGACDCGPAAKPPGAAP